MHIFDSLPLASSAATQSRNRKRLQTERLERRQLLAADGLMALADTAIAPAEMSVAEVASWGGATGRSAEQASSFVGRLQQVEQDGEIRVASAEGEWEKFNTNDQTQVLDAAGNAVNLDELAGVKVRVTYHTEGTQQVADVVQVCRVQVAAWSGAAGRSAEQGSSFVGRLQQVEQDGEIRVASAQGEWEKFNTNDQTQVVDAAGNAVNLDELAGVKVRVTYHTEGTQQVADVVQVCRYQVAATAAGRLHGLAEGGPWGSRRDDLDRSAAGWVWAEGLSREADTLDRLFARGEIG